MGESDREAPWTADQLFIVKTLSSVYGVTMHSTLLEQQFIRSMRTMELTQLF